MEKKTNSFWVSICSIVAIGSLGLFLVNKDMFKTETKSSYSKAISSARGNLGNFTLLDHQGRFNELYRLADSKAVVVVGYTNTCTPLLQSARELVKLSATLKAQNIALFMITPNTSDQRTALVQMASKYEFDFPILMDPSQLVTESLGITQAMESVVIDPIEWKVKYRGSFGDLNAKKILDLIAKNSPLSTPNLSRNPGCIYTFDQPKSLSYEKTIAPLLMAKCLLCHSGPKAYLPTLNSYEKFKNWTAMSRETIMTDRMPPSGPDDFYGDYTNSYAITSAEKRALIKWIDAGAPREDNSSPDVLAGFRRKKRETKKFDLLYTADTGKPIVIPARGTIEYLFTQLGGPTPEDMWVKGFKTTSTNPRQLHHAALMVTSNTLEYYSNLRDKKFPERKVVVSESIDGDIPTYTLGTIRSDEKQYGKRHFTRNQVWAAGRPQPFMFQKDSGIFVPKGSYLILESHYMGSGKEETEEMKIEFYGFKSKPKVFNQLHVLMLRNKDINIPPLKKEHVVTTGTVTVKRDILFVSALTHLHMRGKSVKVFQTTPNGATTTLLSIPNYYYGWQTGSSIRPKTPILITKGSKLSAECRYDNSSQNPHNPDPGKRVTFGQRIDTTEMCSFSIVYYDK